MKSNLVGNNYENEDDHYNETEYFDENYRESINLSLHTGNKTSKILGQIMICTMIRRAPRYNILRV